MPQKCHPFSPNLVRHLFEKDASCPETGQAAILDLQDQLRGPHVTRVFAWFTSAMPLCYLTRICAKSSNKIQSALIHEYYFLSQIQIQILIDNSNAFISLKVNKLCNKL